MESRLRLFLLGIFAVMPFSAVAQEKQPADAEQPKEIIQQDPVIQPAVKRREVKQADIDTENFELSAYAGILSIEDFGSEPVYGLRLNYHITEDFFLQGAIGISEAGRTSAETFTGSTILTEEQRNYEFYTVAIGYNLLPGEAFIGRKTAFNTALYLIAGAGNTTFAGDDRFTITWGGGYRITVTDWMAVHLDVRDHIYSIDITGEDKNVNNFETSIGLSFFF